MRQGWSCEGSFDNLDPHLELLRGLMPPHFLQIPGKIDTILVTGNLCTKETFDYFKSLTADVHAVAGEYDEVPLLFPASLSFPRVGVFCH